MGESALKKILGSLAEKEEGKQPSGWKAFFLIIGAIILVALVAIPIVLARRKAAKVAHERDVLLEEKEHLAATETVEPNNEKREELKADVERIDTEIATLDAKLEELGGARDKFHDDLSALLEKWN